MSELIYTGKIDGEFYGFDDETLFKMINGTYWLQDQYQYWYHYAYRPNVTITREQRQYILTVANHSIPIRKVTNVVESIINGTFEGWRGDTCYTLQNGQVWQQKNYKYEYKYAYMPAAIVYQAGDGYKMMVDGTIADVQQLR
jgi:hypothetical protein